MKKYVLSLAAALLTLGFTACEDVPAPYEINGEETESNTILSETFSNSLGEFSTICTVGDFPWNCNFGCVQTTSYVDKDGDGVKENHPADSWLISPHMNLSKVENAHISFEYILRYANANELKDFYQLLISKDYSGRPADANWTALEYNQEQGSDWDTWYKSGNIDIPAEFIGQENVTIALRYRAESKGATWEVKNLKVEKGAGDYKPGATPDPETPPVGGNNILENSDFELWTAAGQPEAWISTTTASSAKLSQSEDAHGGKYAVLVGSHETQNKRLASKEYTLKPGSYTMSFYVKGEGQVRPGYCLVGEDGKIPSQNGYIYGERASSTANEWTQVTYAFKLDKQTKVNFVVMNPKKSNFAEASDKLIDDFTVTTADGGLAEGPSQPEPDPTPGEAIFTESFAGGQGNFTIDTKVNAGNLEYIWNHDSRYSCMKASAFFNNESHQSESWLISPVVDLSKSAAPELSFEHVFNKGDVNKMSEQLTLYVKAENSEWKQLPIATYSSGTSWSDWTISTQSLAAYKGKKIQFAFVYKSEQASSGTWEVKNVTVK